MSRLRMKTTTRAWASIAVQGTFLLVRDTHESEVSNHGVNYGMGCLETSCHMALVT